MDTFASILTHPLVQRLGWALLHSLWQGLLASLLLGIFLFFLRLRSAGARYLCSCTALMLALAMPTATLFLVHVPHHTVWTPPAPSELPLPSEAPNETPVYSPALIDTSIPPRAMPPSAVIPVAPTTPSSVGISEQLEPYLPWAVLFWLVGVCVLSLRLLGGWVKVQRIKRRYVQPAAAEWQKMIEQLMHQLRISHPVRLLESALVQAPAAIGWIKPVILLPAAALTGLTPEQLRMILAHELAHIRRYDYLVNLLQTVIETLLFYHPAVWWISRRIRAERENCCDDIAVAAGGRPLDYARALTELESLRGPSPSLVAAASGGSLLERIRRILNLPTAGHNYLSRSLAGAILIATLMTLGLGLYGYTKGTEVWAEETEELPARMEVLNQTPTQMEDIRELAESIFTAVRSGRDREANLLTGMGIVSGPWDGERKVLDFSNIQLDTVYADQEAALISSNALPDKYGRLKCILIELRKAPEEFQKQNVYWMGRDFQGCYFDDRKVRINGFLKRNPQAKLIPPITNAASTQPTPGKITATIEPLNRLSDQSPGQYRWRIRSEQPFRLVHGWLSIVDGRIAENVGDGVTREAESNVLELAFSRVIENGLLEMTMSRSWSRTKKGQGKITAQATGKTNIPEQDQIDEVDFDQDGTISDDYVILWQCRFIRNSKVAKHVAYVARLASDDDPVNSFDRNEARLVFDAISKKGRASPVPTATRSVSATQPVAVPAEFDSNRRELFFHGLDLSKTPVETKVWRLPDLWHAVPPGSGSYEIRPEVQILYSGLDGVVYWLPDQDMFYVQHDHWGSSILHYYGPFYGNPRKILNLPSTTQPTTTTDESLWGEAVEGAQIRLQPEKKTWKTGETPAFRVDARNTGARVFVFDDESHWNEIEIDGQWYKPEKATEAGARITLSAISTPITLASEWEPLSDKEVAEYALRHSQSTYRVIDPEKRLNLTLSPGWHTLRVAFIAIPAEDNINDPVRVVSNSVEIEVVPADSANPATRPAVYPTEGDQPSAQPAKVPAEKPPFPHDPNEGFQQSFRVTYWDGSGYRSGGTHTHLSGRIPAGSYELGQLIEVDGSSGMVFRHNLRGIEHRVRVGDKKHHWTAGRVIASDTMNGVTVEQIIFDGVPIDLPWQAAIDVRLPVNASTTQPAGEFWKRIGPSDLPPPPFPWEYPVRDAARDLLSEIQRDAFTQHAEISRFLLEGGTRDEAAKRFHMIAEKSPRSRYGQIAGELATLLMKMTEEDRLYQEPANLDVLSEQQRIEHYIFMLRDVAEQAMCVPGKCEVLWHPRTPNSAAVALRKIGKPAIPALLELLDDPRPTRSFSSELNGNYLLRYSDVALEIIEVIACRQFDPRTQRGTYLANADSATRALISARARTWWKNHKDATEAQWIRKSLSETGIGSFWNRLNSAERLIELEGAQSVGFFRERIPVEPDNPHLPRLLFQAGGKVVLEDIRSMALSGNLEVRQAAAKILQQIQDADAKPNPAATKPTSQPNG